MSNQIVEAEDTVVNFSKNKTHSKIVALIQDNVALDRESFLEDLAEALDVEVTELPTVEAVLHITFGNSTIKIPAFEAPEKDEDEDEDF